MKVVIAGAGVAGLEAMLALHELAADRVELELIAADLQFTYRPAAVAEPFGLAERHVFDVAAIARRCGARLHHSRLDEIDEVEGTGLMEDGRRIEFDLLLVASGARAIPALPGALTFRGPPDVPAYRELLADLRSGAVQRLAFAVPHGVVWPLPLYELALLTAAHAAEHGRRPTLTLITPEERALDLFGTAASAVATALLVEHGVRLLTGSFPIGFAGHRLSLAPQGALDADRCVALPVLTGDPVRGLPYNGGGFLEVDGFGLVVGCKRVYAAGDVIRYPVKLGSLAAQQADAAARTIAFRAGAPVQPQPFRPDLRALLLTRSGLRLLSSVPAARSEPPPAKPEARLLTSVLAEHAAAAS
jgi:sulfide:quinone oxidoreductase